MIYLKFEVKNDEGHMYSPDGNEIFTLHEFVELIEYHWNKNEDVILIWNNDHYLAVENVNDECNSCQFMNASPCPFCANINYFKLKDLGKRKVDNLKSKLCNLDLCIYYGDCDNAPICLLKMIESS